MTASIYTTCTIDATSWHPVWVAAEGRFVNIGDLKPSQQLTSLDGSWTEVASVRRRVPLEPVFDLTVDGVHTYYVVAGDSDLLVHNRDDPWMDATGLRHTKIGHVRGGKNNDPTKSTFEDELTDNDFFDMVDDAARVPGVVQTNGRCARVCTAQNIIGADQSGLPTKEYTVISEPNGRVVTMHPGRPI